MLGFTLFFTIIYYMGNKISTTSDYITINIFTNLETMKPIKCRLEEINVHYHNTYILFKTTKKIDFQKINNVRVLANANYINKENIIFNSSKTLIDFTFDINSGLIPNKVCNKHYLEKHIDNIFNDISIIVRINSKNNLLENILMKIPSDKYREIPIKN